MTRQPPLQFGDQLDNLIREHADTFRPGFALWLRDNRHVWTAFEAEADKVWARGRRHWSARTILEYLRHETAISDSGIEFRLNNNAQDDLARLYLLVHPDRAGFFETRVAPGSSRAA